MPFPVIKLFSLFIKQLSKPAAAYLKRKAKENYWIRTYICIPPAQLWVRASRPLIRGRVRPLDRQNSDQPFLDSYSRTPLHSTKEVDFYHKLDVRLLMWSSGQKKGKDFHVTRLSDTAAIDMGADMLSEGFIFVVGAGIIGLEYWRQTASAARKEHKQDVNLVKLRNDVTFLCNRFHHQRDQIDQLTTMVASLDKKGFKLVPADPVADRKKLRPP